MLLYPHRRFFLYNTNNNINTILMAASKHLLLPFNSTTTNNITTTTSTPPPFAATATTTTTTTATFISSSSQSRLFNTTTTTTRNHRRRLIFYSLSSRTFSSTPRPAIPRPVLLEEPEQQVQDSAEMRELRQKLEEFGIDGDFQKPGQYTHLICPKCGGGDSMEKSLSLFIEQDGNTAVWICHRAKCGWKGGTRASTEIKSAFGNLNMSTTVKQPKRVITETSLELQPLCNELLAYFAERMISKETLRRNSVMQRRFGNQIVIAFTYRKNGVLVNCKYRDISKRFWQESNTEKIFYGLDDIKGASDIIIVEGEMDKLAMEEAGFCSCVSVPDGAPPSVSPKEVPSQEKDKKYQYLWNCKEYLQKASRIILATDGDPPGQALAEELARRLGRERCWRVRWPKKDSDRHFKDANEVLMHLGPGALREVIEHAELYPIQGLFNFSDYFSEIDAYYRQSLGFELGVSTGWRSLNDLYNVVPGELTVVTGVPNSGKSEWIDALLCNLNHSVGWKFALCSMENKVQEHARKLLEKHIKKPFFDVRYGESAERMSVEELEQGKEWLSDTFSLIRCENDCLPDIDWVLELAKAAVLRHGVNGLVIDLYNELDHQRPPSQIETEYVSQMLTKIKRFAQHHSCHVWFVAHPRQLHHWVGSPPNLYDISGSAHFINKFDNGIVDKDPIRIEQRIKHRGDPLGGSSGVGSGSHAPPSTAPLSDTDRLIEAMSQMQTATNRRINAWGKSLRKQINDLGCTTQNDMETVRIQVSNLNSWADGYTAWIQEHGGKPPIPPDESYVPPQPEYQEYQDELDDEDGEEDDADEEED